jgi:hypothetical protein
MSQLIGRGPGRPFQPGQSGNPGGRLARSSAEIARGYGAKIVHAMIKALFIPDAPFTSAGIANAHDVWCRCEGTVTDKFVINGGAGLDLLHPNYCAELQLMQQPTEPAPAVFLPGLDALPDLDERPPALPDETTLIPDSATLRAVLLRYLPYAQAVIVRGATVPGTETTSVGVTARRILLERGYGKLANTIEIDGHANTPAELFLAAHKAINDRLEDTVTCDPPDLSLHNDDGVPARSCEGGDPEAGVELWFSRARHRCL